MAYLERYHLQDINRNQDGLLGFDEQIGGGGIDRQGEDVLIDAGGGGGGGSRTNPNDLDTTTTLRDNTANTDEYTVRITAEYGDSPSGAATVYLNGFPLPNQTPNEYKVKLSDLFTTGPQTFEVKRDKYTTNQKYILNVVPFGDNSIDDITLLEDVANRRIDGINQLSLDVQYFEGDEKKPFRLLNKTGGLVNLPFILYKKPVEIIKDELKQITFTLNGPDSSVQVITPDEDELLDSGVEDFEEKKGTKFILKSPNTTLYRITEVTITDDEGISEKLTAGKYESVSVEINLTKNLTVDIITKNVIKKTVVKPIIRLKGNPLKNYNINDKTDIPVIVEKNEAVKAISLIIGDEILEFDTLTKGQYQGIQIPSRLIDKIGTYNIKLVPYSISELLTAQKDREEKELPPPPPPPKDKKIKEESVVVDTTPKENNDKPVSRDKYKFNPKVFSPQRGGGGRGSVNEIRDSYDEPFDTFDRLGGRS